MHTDTTTGGNSTWTAVQRPNPPKQHCHHHCHCRCHSYWQPYPNYWPQYPWPGTAAPYGPYWSILQPYTTTSPFPSTTGSTTTTSREEYEA